MNLNLKSDQQLIYKFTYHGEHYYELVLDEHHSLHIAIGAGCAMKTRDVPMLDFYEINKIVNP